MMTLQSSNVKYRQSHVIFVGFTVLELSKVHMYDFHYNHMKAKYPRVDQLKLLFTDTDSLA